MKTPIKYQRSELLAIAESLEAQAKEVRRVVAESYPKKREVRKTEPIQEVPVIRYSRTVMGS